MKSKLYKLTFLPILSLIFLNSCKQKDSNESCPCSKKNLSINIEQGPNTLDGRKARTTNDYSIIKALNEGLFRTDKEGIIAPAIAKSYTISADGKTYTIELKETLWSNGDPLTANHFIQSWKSSTAKGFPSPNLSFLYAIKNAKNIKEGKLPLSMLGAYADGDYKLVIHLESPIPFFLELLSQTVFFPMHPQNEGNTNISLSPTNYICNGPFTLKEWNAKDSIIIKKNPNYWDAKVVALDTVSMIMLDDETGLNMYQNNELDIIGSPLSKIPSEHIPHLEGRDDLKDAPFLCTYWLRTNTDKFPLNNKNFRKSLAYSINRKEIIDHVFGGKAEVATGIVPKVMGIQKAPYFEDNNIELAKKCMYTACKELSISKKRMPSITLSYKASKENQAIAAILQDKWKKELGVNLVLEALDKKVFFDKVAKGDYELAWSAWTGDFNDATNFLEVFKTKDVGSNNTNWESPDYIAAINKSYEETVAEPRKRELITAESIIMNDMPVIPIMHTSMLYLQNEKVKDFVVNETGRVDFKWAYIEN